MNAKPLVDYTLYLVTDRALAGGRPLEEVVERSLMGGVTVVQLREKDSSAREFLRMALRLKEILSRRKVPLIINDRLDIALASGAQGVHVGQDDLECSVVREIVGDRFIIGVSVSTVAEALQAEAQGADYLGVSPIFETPTKPDTPPATGLEGLGRIRSAVRLPLVAIGGIRAHNAAQVIQNGADGIAVVSALMSAADPEKAAQELIQAVSHGRSSTHGGCR